MTITPEKPRRRWLVVFHDNPDAMRILAVVPAPDNPDIYDELRNEMYIECLSSYDIDATTATQARHTARQLHDVDRIRNVCARLRTNRGRHCPAPQTRTAPGGRQALTRAAQTLALTHPAAQRADDIVMTALRAGYRHRPVSERHLTFEQYVDHLTLPTAATLYQHAALLAAGRDEEAVAVLVHALTAPATAL
jgi:hypothetical protein